MAAWEIVKDFKKEILGILSRKRWLIVDFISKLISRGVRKILYSSRVIFESVDKVVLKIQLNMFFTYYYVINCACVIKINIDLD